jgi:steroid delta-isomerase-like uncharacterized protein
MSPEANVALVRRLIDEVWNGGKLDAADGLIASDYVRNAPNAAPGLDAFKQFVTAIRTAFTDGGLVVEDIFAGDDKVMVRWKRHGIHTGDFFGITATGKPIVLTGIDIYRVADGKLAENWDEVDMLGLLRQLGVVPV